MPKNLAKEDVNFGEIVFQWAVKEYEKHERGKKWYWIAGAVVLLLMLYAIVTGNYLFALIISLGSIILFLQDIHDPLDVNFAITETGVIVGNKFYSFSELKNYWIVYNPPSVKNLYFITGELLKHRMQIPLLDIDPRPIRDFLNRYLQEDLDQEEEPFSDRLDRILKLH